MSPSEQPHIRVIGDGPVRVVGPVQSGALSLGLHRCDQERHAEEPQQLLATEEPGQLTSGRLPEPATPPPQSVFGVPNFKYQESCLFSLFLWWLSCVLQSPGSPGTSARSRCWPSAPAAAAAPSGCSAQPAGSSPEPPVPPAHTHTHTRCNIFTGQWKALLHAFHKQDKN